MHKPIPNFWQLLHLTRNWNRSNTCPQNRYNTFPVNFGQIILRYYFDKHSIKNRTSQRGRQEKGYEIYFTHFTEFYPKELSLLTVDRSNLLKQVQYKLKE